MLDVAVSMPIYNRKEITKKCIESFLVNSPKNSKLYCIDNGSTDGTKELLKHYENNPKIDIKYSNVNLYPGLSHVDNLSRASKAEMYYLADNDCFFINHNWYVYPKEIFNREPDVSMIGTRTSIFERHVPTNDDLKNKKTVLDSFYVEFPYQAAYTMINEEAKELIVNHIEGKWIGGFIVPLIQRLSSTKKVVSIYPGIVPDLSDFDFNNPENLQYYENIWQSKGNITGLRMRQTNLSIK